MRWTDVDLEIRKAVVSPFSLVRLDIKDRGDGTSLIVSIDGGGRKFSHYNLTMNPQKALDDTLVWIGKCNLAVQQAQNERLSRR